MRRHSYRAGFWFVGMTMLAGAALVACSSSSSSSTPTPTQATAASTSVPTSASSEITATTGGTTPQATTASSSSSGTLPGDACTLLTEAAATQLAGTAVTAHTSAPHPGVFKGGTTAPCDYYGNNGTGDHPVTLWVTSFADAGTAQTFMQGQTSLYKVGAQGFQSVSGIGDEAIEYKVDGASVVQARVGSLVVLLQAGNSDFPGPDLSAVESAVKTVIGGL